MSKVDQLSEDVLKKVHNKQKKNREVEKQKYQGGMGFVL